MKLFITGATGYIGFSAAAAFRRAGYEVWGLTRSQKKASWLACNEIHPVIGSLQEPDTFIMGSWLTWISTLRPGRPASKTNFMEVVIREQTLP